MRLLKNERGAVPAIVILELTLIGVVAASVLVSINLNRSVINYAHSAEDNMEQEAEHLARQFEIEEFNSTFTKYVGETTNTNIIKNLQQSIKASNATNTDHTVKYTGPEDIKVTGKYGVNVKYDNNGYVCEVIVTELK